MRLRRHGPCFGDVQSDAGKGAAMLRITLNEKPEALTFQLEGRLAGPWVQVLQECWQSELARQRHPVRRVDLTAVTSIDAAGQACLAAMHRGGVEFIAADCLTKAVVAEVTQGPAPRANAGPRSDELIPRKVRESNGRFHIEKTHSNATA